MNDLSIIKGIAFDLDGTLVDSLPGLTSAISLALQDRGLQGVTENQTERWIGNGADRLIHRALVAQHVDINDELLFDVRACYDKHYEICSKTGTSCYKDVLFVLKTLQEMGFKLAVVTNKPSKFVLPMLVDMGIAEYFDVIIGGDDASCRKPHPAPIYLLLAKLGLHAGQLLVVGDSKNDINAAKAAGCQSVGMTYGYNYCEPITLSSPTFVIDKFIDILSLFGAK